jgi:Zn-dependent peptidase ImmA (M78 family)
MKRKIDKKKTELLEDFLSLGEKCDIKIIHDKGDFNGDNCLLFANNTIVINKHKPLDQRLHVLAKCFSQINLENVYIKPVLRDLIEQAKTDKVYE